MTGSLQIKSNKYYVVLNMRDELGKRKRKWINTQLTVDGNNKRKAEKLLRELIVKYQNRKIVSTENKKFSVYLTEWLDGLENHLEFESWRGYKYQVDGHIAPYFEKLNVTLQDVEPIHIQNYYTVKLKEGLSANTIKHHHANIRKALQDAMLMNIIPYNPADRVNLPKVHKYSANFYNAEQTIKLLDIIKGISIETPVFLCVYYGLRRSEVLGLKWSAVDFANKTIAIDTTVTKMDDVREKKRTKNASSNRVLPLIPDVERHLKLVSKRQKENRLLFGGAYTQNDYVCKREDGSAFNPGYLSVMFKRTLLQNKLPPIRFHDLRHSCAGILMAAGCDLKKISEWLGHNDIRTTANTYGHLEFKSKVEIGNSMQNALRATVK